MNQLILTLFYILCLVSCRKSQKVIDTPSEFKNTVVVSKALYKSDSIKISNTLNEMIVNHEDFFYSYTPEFVDTTSSKVMVDTILYNSDKNKRFILVTIEYTAKEFRKDIEGEVKILNNVTLYDGMGILVKKHSHQPLNFYSYGYEIGNSNTKSKSKHRLFTVYFKELSSSHEKTYNRYNIDDKRMWDEAMWGKF